MRRNHAPRRLLRRWPWVVLGFLCMTALYVYRECFQHINAVAGSNVGSIRHVPASHNQGDMVSVMDTARCRALLSSNAIEAFETRMAIPTDDNPHQVSLYYRLRNLRVMEGDRYMDDAVLVVVVYNNKESWGSGRSVQDFLELVRSFDYPSAKLSLGILTSSLDEYDNLKQLLHTPLCHLTGTNFDYDLNAWRGHRKTPTPLELDGLRRGDLTFVPGPLNDGFTRHMNDMRWHEYHPLDSVGGTMLYVKADIHRQGVVFTTHHVIGSDWTFEGYDGIETEGLCYVAGLLGYKCYAMPQDTIYHHPAKQ
ncbi:hypothetical protein B5M09_010729 [Aphanomyces astaci]|uniref:Uncharacterized protein n=1 Tax=Aphanomyces astaci TaxID=112090 RepID=A0A425CX26_APHAT|nr:hypothetical protein B5M09_010729 [Aphanomyces astaci]